MSGVAGMQVLDLFSAAAGGWSLGMHRAGFRTVAACEAAEWRRILYAENNPGVLLYDDVRILTADRLVRDLGSLPRVIVGSPPCQDISSANTKGKGVEGERSGLFFEALRIIGDVRPRWLALENSANLRTRGADAVLAALEALGYACWPFVVRAGDIGANHERPRSWLIGCDLSQVTDSDGHGRTERWGGRGLGLHVSVPPHIGAPTNADETRYAGRPSLRPGWETRDQHAGDYEPDGVGPLGAGKASNAYSDTPPDPDQKGQADGCVVPSLRQEEIAVDGRGAGRGDDGPRAGQMDLREADRVAALQRRPDWSLDDLADRVLLDARIQAWTFVAFLLDAGGEECLAERLIVEARSAGFAARLSLGSDLQAALRTVLASYGESTAHRLAPIAETLLIECNITLALENSWEALAKSAREASVSPSIISTKTGPTTQKTTSKRSARRATQNTICAPDLKAVHRRAEQRFKRSASRLVEAFGDAVIPQIPEAIGRAILRVEGAMSAVCRRAAA